MFIGVSTECAAFIFRVRAELIGELKNVKCLGQLQGLYTVNVAPIFNTVQAV
jgi:hypothetical protein